MTKEELEKLFLKNEKDFSYNHMDYFNRLVKLLEYKIRNEYKKIFVLATDIKKENEKIVFREKDNSGALDNYFRLDSVIKLINEKKMEKVFLVGGFNKDIGKFRTEIMKDYIEGELKKKSKNLENKLSERKCCPGNTCGNIVEIVNCLNRECSKGEKISVLTNIYHIPRIEEFIKDCKESYLNCIEFIPAEIVLNNKKKTKIIEFYNRKEMKKRFSNEINGVKEIREGKYSCRKYLDPNYLN